ncbi:MAG: hypothetical protein M0037_00230 [Betaproteobacteria bacterium]|nr:hypothetical protein [Betaproteobacteria bacterium]
MSVSLQWNVPGRRAMVVGPGHTCLQVFARKISPMASNVNEIEDRFLSRGKESLGDGLAEVGLTKYERKPLASDMG